MTSTWPWALRVAARRIALPKAASLISAIAPIPPSGDPEQILRVYLIHRGQEAQVIKRHPPALIFDLRQRCHRQSATPMDILQREALEQPVVSKSNPDFDL